MRPLIAIGIIVVSMPLACFLFLPPFFGWLAINLIILFGFLCALFIRWDYLLNERALLKTPAFYVFVYFWCWPLSAAAKTFEDFNPEFSVAHRGLMLFLKLPALIAVAVPTMILGAILVALIWWPFQALLDSRRLHREALLAALSKERKIVHGDNYEGVTVTGQGNAVGRGATAEVHNSSSTVQAADLSKGLTALAELVRKEKSRCDVEIEASLVEEAAKKAQQGDSTGAAAFLRKSAAWVLDLARTVGSDVLTAFIKSHVGIS